MSALDERLRQAEQAAQAQAVLDRQKTLADELPTLLQEQQHEQRVAQAETVLLETKAWAKAEFARLAKETTDIRDSFAQVLAVLEAMGQELPTLQGRIHAVVRRLQQASTAMVTAQHQGRWTEEARFAANMAGSDLFATSLQECGGCDPGLACLPEGGDKLAEQVKDAIRRKAGGVTVYDPARGVAPYVSL